MLESRINKNILSIIENCDDEFAREVNSSIDHYEKHLKDILAEENVWHFTSTADLVKKLESPYKDKNYKLYNKIYWEDFYEFIDAVKNIFIKRSFPLIMSSINLINNLDLISSASVARSLFEISIWSIHHSATCKNTLASLPKNISSEHSILDCSNLQDIIFKLIWGTKLKERVEKHDSLKQLHITKEFLKVSQRDKGNYIEPLYDFLCELCHPNVIGNWLFLREEGKLPEDGKYSIRISSFQIGNEAKNVIEKILGCISWSSIAMVNANIQFEEALNHIKNKFGINKYSSH